MLFPELPIVFPWYPKIEQQNRYNENVEPVCDYKLVTPKDALLPFQFTKPIAGVMPTTWEVYDINSNNPVANITDSIPMLQVRRREGKEYFYYDGRQLMAAFDLTMSLPPGYFYSRMVFPTGEIFFSEMFHVPIDGAFNIADDDNIQFIKLEWWNDGDLRPIFYNHVEPGQTKPVFRNVAYIDTFITASEPEITEDGTRDGEDELIPTFQKIVIPYRVTVPVPDFLKKALMTMQMHDHIWITLKKGVRSGEIRKVVVSSALEASGALSIIDILFQQDMAMVKKGCADNLTTDCVGSAPVLSPVVQDGANYTLTGSAPAGATITVYKMDTLTSIPVAVGVSFSSTAFAAGANVPTSLFTGSLYILVRAGAFGCDFGFSNTAVKP